MNYEVNVPNNQAEGTPFVRASVVLPDDVMTRLTLLGEPFGKNSLLSLLSAFLVIVHRYSQQDTICLLTPPADRFRRHMLNDRSSPDMVFSRNSLADDPTFVQVLDRVSTAVEAARTRRRSGKRRRRPAESVNSRPNWALIARVVGDDVCPNTVEFTTQNDVNPWSRTAGLSLFLVRRTAGCEVHVVSAAAQFSGNDIMCLAEQYRAVVKQASFAPDSRISSYSLITEQSRHVLPDPSRSLAEPKLPPITSLFIRQARRTAESVAIRQNGLRWTYRDLLRRSSRFARQLCAEGLQQADVIAILGPHSFGLTVSMLATWLAGGIVLPLDPGLPRPRLSAMLRISRARFLIHVTTPGARYERVKRWGRVEALRVDGMTGCFLNAEPKARRPRPVIRPADAAYIFFTSGTTGTPKAVLGNHKGLSQFLLWQRDTFSVRHGDRCAQLTSLSFDVVLRAMFLPLISGATLCLPRGEDAFVVDSVVSWMESEQVSLVHLVPTLAQHWLRTVPRGASLRRLRCVFFAGERLIDSLVRRWRAIFPQTCELVNLYGPTETTLAKFCFRIPRDISAGVQPVGWPLPSTQGLVLNANGQLCGVGELGEIYIRTPFCTLGYVNAPDEQRERFVRNPFFTGDTVPLYRTGDLGRYRADGALEVLGRVDDQAKIRGVRVEPGEVAGVLTRHSSVDSCAVLPSRDNSGDVSLTAYVVAAKGEAIHSQELRRFLSQRLPAVMVPAMFVGLDALPVTRNGKVDRAALLALPRHASPPTNPRTRTEKTLVQLWQETIGVRPSSMEKSFSELGGHSLLAARLLSRVHRVFKVSVPFRTILEAPTIRSLAQLIDELSARQRPTDPRRQGRTGSMRESRLTHLSIRRH